MNKSGVRIDPTCNAHYLREVARLHMRRANIVPFGAERFPPDMYLDSMLILH